MDVNYEKGGVAAKVISSDHLPREPYVRRFLREPANIDHDFGALIICEIGVYDVSFRVGSPSQDITSIARIILSCYANAVGPRFLDAK